jgi:hypothetical protein
VSKNWVSKANPTPFFIKKSGIGLFWQGTVHHTSHLSPDCPYWLVGAGESLRDTLLMKKCWPPREFRWPKLAIDWRLGSWWPILVFKRVKILWPWPFREFLLPDCLSLAYRSLGTQNSWYWSSRQFTLSCQYLSLPENLLQLPCRLIPSYYSFTSKLIQKNFSCTVTVHNAQWLCIEVVLKCYLSKIQVTAEVKSK